METNGLKITAVDNVKDIVVMDEPVNTPDVPEAPESVTSPETPEAPDPVPPVEEITDEKVLSFFEKRFGKKLDTLDNLFDVPEPQVVEKEVELEEDVAAFNRYKKETGRGLSDFMKLQKDFSEMDPEQVLIEYYSIKNPKWTREDVLFKINRQFGFDQELDDPDDIKERKLNMMSEVERAVSELNDLKAKYATPLESKGLVPEEERTAYEAFRQQRTTEAERKAASEAESKLFTDETLKVFPEDFKGFDFDVADGKTITFKPEETDKIIQKQTNLTEWLNGFKDKNGTWNNVAGFHKALNMAMYGESLIKHAYEQGKADQVVEFEKQEKNINMPKSRPIVPGSPGLKITVMDPNPSSGSLSIKSIKK